MRNRIRAHLKVRAGDLVPHEDNPRLHSEAQRQALRALLGEVGFARSVLAYELPDGRLKLIDGHLRREEIGPEEPIDVEVLDVDDDEARKLLLAIDPLAQLAEYDAAGLAALRGVVEADSEAVRALWAAVDAANRGTRDRLADAVGAEEEVIPEQFLVVIACTDEEQQTRLLEEFRQRRLNPEITMHTTIIVTTPIDDTPRVRQIRGMFDLPPEAHATLTWDVRLPLDENPWNVGLIVGPSGCGKSTVAKRLWPEEMRQGAQLAWPELRSVLDAFPAALGIKEITELLCSVGFSSPPAWLRPFRVLSTGQQFRVTLARLLAESPDLVVFDEYSSVVDRTVARVGSAALAKTVRQRGRRFVAVTCHEDVEEWLQPDWVYRPAEGLFARRCLRRRPPLTLRVVRCQASAWPLFRPHHYLSHRLAPSAVCFLATWLEQPVAFSAWLPFVGGGPLARREHRTVCLPDFQGVGIGNALSACVASLWRGLGYRALSTTTHPSMIRARARSPHWRMRRKPSFAAGHEGRLRHAVTRLTAGFEYVGPPMPRKQAELLLGM